MVNTILAKRVNYIVAKGDHPVWTKGSKSHGFSKIRESKIMCTANHLVEAEKVLRRMIEKNPVLQKLIDDFDLVLVGASPIESSG